MRAQLYRERTAPCNVMGVERRNTTACRVQPSDYNATTRALYEMCAKCIIAVEPLEYRLAIAKTMGPHHTVSPEAALALIHAETNGRGADIVCEMVGHNQDTSTHINGAPLGSHPPTLCAWHTAGTLPTP